MTKLTGLHAYLNVSNVEKSAAFYEGLGFTRQMTYPPPMNVIVYGLGDSALLIGPADMDTDEATRRWLMNKPWGVGTVVMPQVKSVDAVYEKAQSIGAEIEQPPADQPWGGRTLMLNDPDGYTLIFEEAEASRKGAAKGTSPRPAKKPASSARKGKTGARKATRGKSRRR